MIKKNNKFNNSKYYWYKINSTIFIKRKLLTTLESMGVNYLMTPVGIIVIILVIKGDLNLLEWLESNISLFGKIYWSSIFIAFYICFPAVSVLSLFWDPKVSVLEDEYILFYNNFKCYKYNYKNIKEIVIQTEKKRKNWRIGFIEKNLNLIIKLDDNRSFKIIHVYLKEKSSGLEDFKNFLVEEIHKRNYNEAYNSIITF